MTTCDPSRLLAVFDAMPDLLALATAEAKAAQGYAYDIQDRLAEEHRQQGVPFIYSMPYRSLTDCPRCNWTTTRIVHQMENPAAADEPCHHRVDVENSVVHLVRQHGGQFPASATAFLENLANAMDHRRLLSVLDGLPDLLAAALEEARETQGDALQIQERLAVEHRAAGLPFLRTQQYMSMTACPLCRWTDTRAEFVLENPARALDAPLSRVTVSNLDAHLAREHGQPLPLPAAAFLQSIAWMSGLPATGEPPRPAPQPPPPVERPRQGLGEALAQGLAKKRRRSG